MIRSGNRKPDPRSKQMLTLRSWLEEGPFTLALSSSFFGFYSHCGVVKALFEQGFVPQKITGASAGALVGGALSSGISPAETQKILLSISKKDFWDPAIGFGVLRGRKFLRLLETHFVANFRQAKIPLEVAAFDVFSCKTRFLANGSLPKAVVASCAVPVLFHPVRIGKRIYFDGGVFHKSGVNLKDKHERILSVFLQRRGASEAYEFYRHLPRLSASQKLIRIQGLPNLDYNSLELGKFALEQAYQRCNKAFLQRFDGNLLDIY